MKLSKAKKLFKAGEIQIHDFNSDFELLKKVTGTNWTHIYNYYYCDEKGQYGSMTEFKNTPIVNLSDIKPSKKKTLKKRVKALEKKINSYEEKSMPLPDGVKTEKQWKETLRATTEPNQ